jgi:hypothetical protein
MNLPGIEAALESLEWDPACGPQPPVMSCSEDAMPLEAVQAMSSRPVSVVGTGAANYHQQLSRGHDQFDDFQSENPKECGKRKLDRIRELNRQAQARYRHKFRARTLLLPRLLARSLPCNGSNLIDTCTFESEAVQ